MSPPTARVDRRSPHPRLCASSARRVLGARHHHDKVAGFVLRRPAPCRSSSPRPRPTRTAIRMADMLTLGDSRCKVLRDYAARCWGPHAARCFGTHAAKCFVTTLEGAARLCCRVLRDFAVEGLQASLKGRFATSLCRGLAGFAAGCAQHAEASFHSQHCGVLFTPSTLKRFSHPAP